MYAGLFPVQAKVPGRWQNEGFSAAWERVVWGLALQLKVVQPLLI